MEKRTDVLAGSHIPVLVKLIMSKFVKAPVIELGVGWSSTPLLHWLCESKDIFLSSYESDKEWLEKFHNFNSSNHQLYKEDFNDPRKLVRLNPSPVGLVFVDHRPARKRRSSALAFKNNAGFIVLHDSELADHPAYKYTPIYKEFRYKYEYTKVRPHTMVLSNFFDPTPILT